MANCAVRVTTEQPAAAEVGVTLSPGRQGSGLATEALDWAADPCGYSPAATLALVQTLQPSKCTLVAGQMLALMTEVAKGSEPRAMALAADLDLSLSQLRALLVLWRAETPLSLHALADGVGLSDPAAVRMVDGLLLGGLVVRREDEHDRRVKRIALTAVGAEAVNRLTAVRRDSLERLAGTLLPEELDRLIAALDPIVERLDLRLDLPAPA